MSDISNDLDNIILAPANWKYDDYKEAKKSVVSLIIRELKNIPLDFEESALEPTEIYVSERMHELEKLL